jgi:hypothetical protein
VGYSLHRELILAFENDGSGVPAERRKLWKIEECGLLPKATTPVLLRSRKELNRHRVDTGQTYANVTALWILN